MNIENMTYDELRLENQLCFPLYACAKEVVRKYRKPLGELSLTYTQYIVMLVLWEYGDMTEGELGERIYLDSSTLTPLLKRLEKAGYIRRKRPENNERTLFISLTEKGRSLKKEAKQVPSVMRSCIPLSDENLIMLRDLLNQMLSDLKGSDETLERR